MKLSIDLDGVLARKKEWSFSDSYERQREMLMAIKPYSEVIKKVNQLYDQGHKIIINTARHWRDYEATIEWLKKYGVKYHSLIMAKPLADYYVDDKNLSLEEFLKNDFN